MLVYYVLAGVAVLLIATVFFLVGKKSNKTSEMVFKLKMLEDSNADLKFNISKLENVIADNDVEIKRITSERDVLKANYENVMSQLEVEREQHKIIILEEQERCAIAVENQRNNMQAQLKQFQDSFNAQLQLAKESYENQISVMRQMSKEQVDSQLNMIREQMQTTSEKVLKSRQEELSAVNNEQVSKIIDPLQQSLKMMREALNESKEKHQEALIKLDATIQANMKNSDHLSDTAERLTRALTGEVKVQGDFGELKLRQLLEDLGLNDGEQYSSQEHLRDKFGKLVRDDEGKNLIPDFILHFPNNRDVIVDSKMSFTAYEKYVNCDEIDKKSFYLKEHIASVRNQVNRLSKKDYSKYLKEGYNKLNFVIMYIHTEGALLLSLNNDTSLWREAYDKGVLLMGPQTMYMNLRVLELMWTQVRQLNNQEDMMKAANQIIERTQDFAMRFCDVESKMYETIRSMEKLKITTSDSGASIITAAKNLLKAGGRENKKKKSLDELPVFVDDDKSTLLLEGSVPKSV